MEEDELGVADALDEAVEVWDKEATEETVEVVDEIGDDRWVVEAAINEAATPMVVIADASPSNCKGCAEPTRASQSQNPFKPSWVRVPFRAAQQYLLSVGLSQFSIPIFGAVSAAQSARTYFLLYTRDYVRLEPIKQKSGHEGDVQVRSVQLPRP